MGFFSVKFGLDSSISQSQLMDLLKSNGAEVIQTSDGLCVKYAKPSADLAALVGQTAGVSLHTIDVKETASDPACSPDVKKFLGL